MSQAHLWERWGYLMGRLAGRKLTEAEAQELDYVRRVLGMPLHGAAQALVARLSGERGSR